VWKVILDSVEGVGHKREQLGCQDASACVEIATPKGPIFCIVCSDGAGSAKHAAYASKYACQHILKHLSEHFGSGQSMDALSKELIKTWLLELRAYFEAEAKSTETTANDYACTLLLCVLSWSEATFAQIGDGAIVVHNGYHYEPVFWPDTGEYLNTTFFVTSPSMEERLNYTSRTGTLNELAVFTDGLQMLSLDYTKKQAHQPFFTPLFTRLREEEATESLLSLLSGFLESDKVNARTDDDKTLVLATRINGD
jgi:hypothetical protein